MTDIHKFFVLHKRMKTTNENGGVEEDTAYDQVSQEKGAFCRFCVLFRPHITHGSHHGAFISRPFTNFKKFHECVKMHMNSEWHKDAIEKSNNFISVVTNKTKILADETMDIAGTEQLSLSAHYFDLVTNVVREDFLGFTPLARLDAKHISNTIISTLSAWGLNLDKTVGQGHDGCSTMAGKIGGVQKIIAEKYPKARFYHCAIHRLNLVVNDLNTLPEVRNAIGTIKEGISFFRGSTQRKVLVGNLQKLCETRWSEKHKSIRKFKDKFLEIVEALAILHKKRDRETRQKAWQLYCTLTSQTFIVTLKVIAKYSAKLEPVTNILRSVNINLDNVEAEFEMIMESAESNSSALGIDVTGIRQPRDSLVQSLQERFSEGNKASFEIFCLHPKVMKSQSDIDMKRIIENIKRFYGDLLDNLTEEARTWISIWKRDKVTEGDIAELSLTDLLDKAKFLPAIASVLKIALSLPATTCSAERSFSTLWRVKTWLRTTMADNRLSCLCMVSVHCDKIKSEEESFIEKVVDSYGKDPRRIQFLFNISNYINMFVTIKQSHHPYNQRSQNLLRHESVMGCGNYYHLLTCLSRGELTDMALCPKNEHLREQFRIFPQH
ncbi:52 kDa repressor of the inhibitor of the protein kinase-like [Schistocerca serialis cubense]|uniref:52 kDa repressor of the inhibitor of the protein kinase-like n=1 Tax=Schistocerca serialis cubense TaxID=2023355 RepID=UPI00214EA5EF|nr:52 kDa repressor of the inhibitor of the protein kinase-like [Schistocerca serialis cubense]